MKTKPLSDPRAEKFVQNLVKGMSQRAAYREAFKSKAKDRSVDTLANRLYKKVDVGLRYKDLMSTVATKVDKKAAADAEKITDMTAEIFYGWRKILKANAMDYLEPRISPKTGRMVLELREDIAGIDGFAIQEISTDSAGNVKLKLYSKTEALRALDELEQRRGAERQAVRLEFAEDLDQYAE